MLQKFDDRHSVRDDLGEHLLRAAEEVTERHLGTHLDGHRHEVRHHTHH